MANIPHKETRYLLPLAVPVTMIAAFGFQQLDRRAMACGSGVRAATAAVAAVVLAVTIAPALLRLGRPWIDPAESGPVRIARFLRQESAAETVIHAAHFSPVLAHYSECTTVSLLPYPKDFGRQ